MKHLSNSMEQEVEIKTSSHTQKQPTEFHQRDNEESKTFRHFSACMKLEVCYTWLPVSMQLRCELVVVFQKRMHRSAVPPPEASSPCICGDHAIAFTAAVCSEYFNIGCVECWFQTKSCTAVRHLAQWDTSCLRGKCTRKEEISSKQHQKKFYRDKNNHILDYHFHPMPIHDCHKTTSVHKPTSK